MPKTKSLFPTKAIVALLFSTLLFTSCGEQKNDSEATKEVAAKTHRHQGGHEQWQEEIQLDNDNRWVANDATTLGVLNMTHLIESSSAQTINDYHKLAKALNDEKNTLIKRCTMKGASHDNLHIYLQPLLKDLALLQEADTTAKGEKTLREILKHLKMYHHYFV